MKIVKLFTSFLILFFFSFSVFAKLEPVYTNPIKPIIVSEQQNEFYIQLASNPTTGYSWFIQDYDSKWIKVKKHQFISYQPSMPGASGLEIWKFKINSNAFKTPQQLKIHFVYQRPWNKEIGKKVTFIVLTQENKI